MTAGRVFAKIHLALMKRRNTKGVVYDPERYRSGHNEAVLKTVCPKGRVGSNPTLSVGFKMQSAEQGCDWNPQNRIVGRWISTFGEVPKMAEGTPLERVQVVNSGARVQIPPSPFARQGSGEKIKKLLTDGRICDKLDKLSDGQQSTLTNKQ